MGVIHNIFTGKEDSYEQAVREAGEENPKIEKYNPEDVSIAEVFLQMGMNKILKQVDQEEYYRQHPSEIPTSHPDYMRLVVHEMD